MPAILRSRPRPRDALLVLLAAAAGWIDALSFTELGRIFTSFQSGNLIFLGLSVGPGHGQRLVGAAVSLTAFLAGSALGAYLVGRAEVAAPAIRSLVPALALEWALLVAFAACWWAVGEPAGDSAGRVALIVLAATAMGVQGAAVFTLRIPGVVTNAMTATLMLGGIHLGLRTHGSDVTEASGVPSLLLAALCLSYVASALVVGSVGHSALTAAVPAAGLTLTLFGLSMRGTARREAAATGHASA